MSTSKMTFQLILLPALCWNSVNIQYCWVAGPLFRQALEKMTNSKLWIYQIKGHWGLVGSSHSFKVISGKSSFDISRTFKTFYKCSGHFTDVAIVSQEWWVSKLQVCIAFHTSTFGISVNRSRTVGEMKIGLNLTDRTRTVLAESLLAGGGGSTVQVHDVALFLQLLLCWHYLHTHSPVVPNLGENIRAAGRMG